MKKNFIAAFFINLTIVILEIIGLIISIQNDKVLTFTFYTTDSNFLALITSFLFCIFAVIAFTTKTPIPKWIKILRFISTACLSLTFFLSICIIIPLYPNLFSLMLLENFGLYHHFLCPLLSIISFIVFEKNEPLKKNVIIFALLPTITYGLINLSLNLLKIISGPYPFFYLFLVPWQTPLLAILFILLTAFAIAFFLYKIYNKKNISLEKY